MNYYINKSRLIISTLALSIVLLLVACDKHKNTEHDEIIIIDISDDTLTYFVEKHAKKGIEISDEERQEIAETIIKERLLGE